MNAADQFGDLVEYLVYFRHDVHAVDAELVAYRPAQGGVQHRATFGGVDDFATEHRLDGVLQAHFVGQVHEQVAALFGDQVFRVVEEQAAAAQGKLLEALGIGGEGFAHAETLHGVAVLLKRLPGGQGRDIVGCTVIRHCAGFPWCVMRPWTRHSLPGSGWHHYRQRPLAGNG
ncbi:flagellar motor switch protein FliN [Pseudomonas putida S16]|nr:flagellar motor switch protein FliN [Pseudomonas putida S16]